MSIEQFVANRIVDLLNKNGITRYQLSQKTGISQTALKGLVNMEHTPTLHTIEKICEGFNMSYVQFFASGEDSVELSDDQREVLGLWESLSAEERRVMKICLTGIRDNGK